MTNLRMNFVNQFARFLLFDRVKIRAVAENGMIAINKIKRSSKIISKYFLNYVPSIKSFSWVLRIDSYQKFPKIRTKSWSKSISKLMGSEKCNFDRVKMWNRNFCHTRMIVFDLGYLLLGWFSCSKYASREKS